jgi:hypothetical protein
MGMTLSVVGVIDKDEQFNKMKKVYDACEKADIEIPDEVTDYFDGEDPNDLIGKEVNINQAIIKGEEYGEDVTYEISKLPAYVKYIRIKLSD